MFALLLNLYRFIKYALMALRKDEDFKSLLLFTVLLLLSSTFFYSQTEGWSVIDALYFSMMTMSTIGYGDYVPSSELSKLFTIVYTFLSIGVFVSLTAKIVDIILKEKHRHKAIRHAHHDLKQNG